MLVLLAASPAQAAPPVVSLWYRGTPPGVPTRDDLDYIRALGFSWITWPIEEAGHLLDVRRLAAESGLSVVVRASIASVTAATALIPSERVDLEISQVKPEEVAAIGWRAVAHGARVISVDGGAKTGAALQADKKAATWTNAALALARQFYGTGALFDEAEPGPPVTVTAPARSGLDVMLLATSRSWVLIATNTDARTVKASVQLPKDVPATMWTSLLDGTTLSMTPQLAGPKWTLNAPAHAALVYVVDKQP